MDYSITKRKGCNYCLRGKDFGQYDFSLSIDDLNKIISISYDRSEISSHGEEEIEINYCPVCGKEL